MKKLSQVAKEHLKYVYIGNVWEVDRNTYCPSCKEVLVDRSYLVKSHVDKEGKCEHCGYQSNIIMRK